MRKIKPKVDKYSLGPSKAPKESKPIYPTTRLDLEHLPEAKEWKLGKTYRIEMEVKLVGLSQSRFDNSAEFEIHGIEADDDVAEEDDDKK